MRAKWLFTLCVATSLAGRVAAQAPAPAAAPADDAPVPVSGKTRPFLGGFLRETRVVYPLRVGDWEAEGEHLFDEQSLGAAVRYRNLKHAQRWLDLYFYPAGILDGREFDEATRVQRESLAMAGYGHLDLGPTRDFHYLVESRHGRGEDTPEPHTGHSLDAAMVSEGVRLHSAMTLQYERLYFIKGRLSAPRGDASRRSLREALESFASALAPQLEIRSSGECWRPLPITPMPAGGAPVASTILSIDDGSGGKSVVTPSGVVADRPDSDAAKAAMLLGMHRMGRIHDGCVATEDLNATVPEGMRELRLEFHAPDELSDGHAPRLRPERVTEG